MLTHEDKKFFWSNLNLIVKIVTCYGYLTLIYLRATLICFFMSWVLQITCSCSNLPCLAYIDGCRMFGDGYSWREHWRFFGLTQWGHMESQLLLLSGVRGVCLCNREVSLTVLLGGRHLHQHGNSSCSLPSYCHVKGRALYPKPTTVPALSTKDRDEWCLPLSDVDGAQHSVGKRMTELVKCQTHIIRCLESELWYTHARYINF